MGDEWALTRALTGLFLADAADAPGLRYAARMIARPESPLRRNRLTSAFERRVAHQLREHLASGSTLLVACSGGPDSTAALVALARVAAQAGGRALAAHFNHGTRPEAETDADRSYVETLAGCLGVRVVSGGGAAPGSGSAAEADAREARYRWLAPAAREAGASACVTGHTLDDQAETVLLRLTRGSGLAGAAGMALDAPWPVVCEAAGGEAPLRLLRPLLGVTRAQVVDYLDALGLAGAGLGPRHDPSNDEIAYSRNRVRHRVMPELRSLNPEAAAALARFAGHARRDDEALEAWSEREAAALLRVEGRTARVARRALRALPEAVGLRLVRRAAAAVGVSVTAEQAERVLAVAARRGAQVDLRGGSARTDDEALTIEGGGGAAPRAT